MTGIDVSPDLNCSATHRGYSHADIFYGGTACATLAVVDGVTYGPEHPAGPSPEAWSPLSQNVAGLGTVASPFMITSRRRPAEPVWC